MAIGVAVTIQMHGVVPISSNIAAKFGF